MANSLEKACTDLGVVIRREAPVRDIVTSAGRAVGVRLEDGSHIDSKVVASSVDAHLTFEKLLTPQELPEYFREAVAKIDYSSASAKINLALNEPPRFTCMNDQPGVIGPHHHGTMHIGPTLEYLERAYDDAKYGQPSERPILEITMPTSVDRTIAPPGKHILSMFVQYARRTSWRTTIGTTSKNRSPTAASPCSPNMPLISPRRSNIARCCRPSTSSARSASPAATSCKAEIEPPPTLLLPPRRRLGRSSHTNSRSLSMRRGKPSGRRRPRSMWQERCRRNLTGYLIHYRDHEGHRGV